MLPTSLGKTPPEPRASLCLYASFSNREIERTGERRQFPPVAAGSFRVGSTQARSPPDVWVKMFGIGKS